MERYLGKTFGEIANLCARGHIPDDLPDEFLVNLIGNATIPIRANSGHCVLRRIWRKNRLGGFNKRHLRIVTVGSFDIECVKLMLEFCDKILRKCEIYDLELQWPENRETALQNTLMLLNYIMKSLRLTRLVVYNLYELLDRYSYAYELRDTLAINVNMTICERLKLSRRYVGHDIVISHEMLPEHWFYDRFLKTFELNELTSNWGNGTIAAKAAIMDNEKIVTKLMGIADASDRYCFAKELARLHAAENYKRKCDRTWIVDIVPDIVMLLRKFGCCAADMITYTGYVEDLYIQIVRDYLDDFPDEYDAILMYILTYKVNVGNVGLERINKLMELHPTSSRQKKLANIFAR